MLRLLTLLYVLASARNCIIVSHNLTAVQAWSLACDNNYTKCDIDNSTTIFLDMLCNDSALAFSDSLWNATCILKKCNKTQSVKNTTCQP
jgi:hypothetical protein